MFDYSKKRPLYDETFEQLNALDLRFSKYIKLSTAGGMCIVVNGRDITKEVKFTLEHERGVHPMHLQKGTTIRGIDLSCVNFDKIHGEIDELNSHLPNGVEAKSYDSTMRLQMYCSDECKENKDDKSFSLFE